MRAGSSRLLVPVPPGAPGAAKRLAALRASLPDRADLVLVGDSLAAGWPPDLLAEALPGMRVLNFGLPGDRIQNTLWRLAAFDLAHLRPSLAAVIVGTNNLGDGDPADEVVSGIAAAASACGRAWPGASLAVSTIPPRAERPGYRDGDRRRVNDALRAIHGEGVLDADAALAAGAGAVPVLEPDGLHLSREGYRRLGEALRARA